MNTYEKAIDYYGNTQQLLKTVEELSELQRDIVRWLNGQENNVAEEIADVEIMIEQSKLILGNREEVERFKAIKLARLLKRMEVVK